MASMHHYFEIIENGHSNGPRKYVLPLVIGESERCHIRIPDTDGEVCFIGEDHGHLFLQPLSETVEVFHNRERIRASVWIKSGDVTRIGKHQLVYDISGDVVTVVVGPAEPATISSRTALAGPNEDSAPSSHELPRVSAPETKRSAARSMLIRTGVPLLIVLAAVALFLLGARIFRVQVSPEPDSLSFGGILPVMKVGGNFLALPFRYTLRAEKEGYQPLVAEIDLADRSKGEFMFEMKPLPGIIDFQTRPREGVDISIDSISIGLTPLSSVEIEAGRHLLQAALERYRPFQQEILVQGRGVHQLFRISLEPAWGYVQLDTEPSGASVIVDGNETGALTPCELEIMEGAHELAFSIKKYLPGKIRIDVRAGEHVQAHKVILEPAPARLVIQGSPEGALVAVDRLYAGRMPCEKEVEAGRDHEISVTAKGYRSANRKVHADAGEESVIEIHLKPLVGTVFISTAPPDAELYIDGRRQDSSSGRFRLPALPHTIEARASGFEPVKKEIVVVAGSSQAVELLLDKKGSHAVSAVSAAGHAPVVKGLVLVRPHAFTMGSSRREQGRSTNEVLHKVNLARPFYFGTREVTNAEFRQFRGEHSSGSFSGHTLNGAKQPVVNVSWEDAARFCNYLSRKEGLPPFYSDDGKGLRVNSPANTGYRLPTEAEWAYAARVFKKSSIAKYPWSGGYPPPDRSGNFADESARGVVAVIIDGYHDGYAVSAPVGSFRADSAGIYDLGGNVSEWCHDYYSPAMPQRVETDPLGPAAGAHHVIRGSSWQDSSITELRLSYRAFGNRPADYVGFRVARYAE